MEIEGLRFRDELTVGDFIEMQTRYPDASADASQANPGKLARANAFMIALLLDDGTSLQEREKRINSLPMSVFIKITTEITRGVSPREGVTKNA